MPSGIYQIENQINGKRYIGSAVNLRKRWATHLCTLRCGQHHNRHLQNAFDKYGEDAFTFEVLEAVELENLIVREQHYFDMLKPEYNIALIAGSTLGVPCSAEARARQSAAKAGERNYNYGKHDSAETRAKKSTARMGKRNPMYGKHHSAETLAKLRAAWTPERRQAQSDRRQGKHHSIDTCIKIRAAKTGERHPMYGKHHSAATKRKMSIARIGKPHPHRSHACNAKTRAKISALMTGERHPFYGKHHSEETKRKMSVARKAYWQRIRKAKNQ